jgi:hypothetical protein
MFALGVAVIIDVVGNLQVVKRWEGIYLYALAAITAEIAVLAGNTVFPVSDAAAVLGVGRGVTVVAVIGG